MPRYALLALLVPLPAAAHDLWLIPPEAAKPKAAVTVRAVQGVKFPAGDRAPDPAKLAERIVVLPDGTAGTFDAGGTDKDAGLLTFDPAKPGVYAVAVKTTPKVLTLAADDFKSYLLSDGLAHVWRQRKKEGTLGQDGKERYSKSPKALVKVGDGGGGDPTKPLGLPLEIVPAADPFNVKVGDTLKVQVLFNGKVLPDAHLGYDTPGEGDEPLGTVRTDAKGEALVPIPAKGLLTIRLTHMTRPKEKTHEWESFWTTLTFRVPG